MNMTDKDTFQPGDLVTIQVAPFGAYKQTTDAGKTIVQEITPETAQALADSFQDEVLVDTDHASEEGGSTAAYGWVTALSVDPAAGLIAEVRLTDLGAQALTGRRFRFVSPAWLVNAAGAPTRMTSLALTNKPNFPLRPIVNRAQGTTPPGGGAIVDSNASDEALEKNNMEKIKELLGLAPEATEEDVAASVQALLDEKAAAAEAAAEAEAAEFAAENAEAVEDPEVLKNAYKANPELTRQLVKNMARRPAPAPAQKVINTAQAKAPDKLVKNSVREGLAACKTAKEQNDYLMAHAAEF